MCHSYDRFIDLAKRTGDRLIIHDPIEGHDVVVMDIDQYERLLDESDFCNDDRRDYYRHDVRDMSERELIDQINRDIAKWRAERDSEERWKREMLLEDEVDKEGPFDPFVEHDYHPADWHSASAVLEDRYKNKIDSWKNDIPNFADEWDDDDEDEWDDEFEDKLERFDKSDDGLSFEEFLEKENNSQADEIKIDDIPDFDLKYNEIGEEGISGGLPISEEGLSEIPFKNESDKIDWLEEPLEDEDEPVFYEEPV